MSLPASVHAVCVSQSHGFPLIIYGQELMHLCAFLLHVTKFSLSFMCACVCVCVWPTTAVPVHMTLLSSMWKAPKA